MGDAGMDTYPGLEEPFLDARDDMVVIKGDVTSANCSSSLS